MTALAVTVLGRDRPGIIAEATAAVAGMGLNLEDSTMTLLRGHFAFMLICSGPTSRDDVARALEPLTADGSLDVSVRVVDAGSDDAASGAHAPSVGYQLVVHGGDRPGIVAALTGPLAAAGGNVTDLSTRLSGGLYVLIAEVDLPAGVDVASLQSRLADIAGSLDVEAALRPVDSDVL